jgi:hypothetical protein
VIISRIFICVSKSIVTNMAVACVPKALTDWHDMALFHTPNKNITLAELEIKSKTDGVSNIYSGLRSGCCFIVKGEQNDRINE